MQTYMQNENALKQKIAKQKKPRKLSLQKKRLPPKKPYKKPQPKLLQRSALTKRQKAFLSLMPKTIKVVTRLRSGIQSVLTNGLRNRNSRSFLLNRSLFFNLTITE